MKKICFVTAARSEYTPLRWIMQDLANSKQCEFQLLVTGGHLMKNQGETIQQIVKDGFVISEIIDAEIDDATQVTIAEAMGRLACMISQAFCRLSPDYVVVLGDRYELLPICSTAFIMGIPIIHISGGDITTGAIDDGVRNAVTMLAAYHFPGTEQAAENIARMRNSKENIWVVGEPGLDAFNRLKLMTRRELAEELKLDIHKKWVLMTYHAETKQSLIYNLAAVRNCLEALEQIEECKDCQVIVTYANADYGGKQINEALEEKAVENGNMFKVLPALGQHRYLSCMRQVSFVIGNSSSGIIEAPFLGIPVINIGERQQGRYQCNNVVQCGTSKEEIVQGIRQGISEKKKKVVDDSKYWGDGHTSEKVTKILLEKVMADGLF